MSGGVSELKGKILGWIAAGASRNRSFSDRVCRVILDRALKLPADDDFMRDEWIDNHTGFDPEELERYQRGES